MMDEMERLADLKGALYPTEGPTDRLRARALAGVGSAATPRRRWVGPMLAAAGVAAVVAAAAVALGGTPYAGDRGASVAVQRAAFAVHVNADGTVTFTAHDVVDTAAATQALNEAGIAGRVINDQTAGCPTKSDDNELEDLYPDDTISRGLGASDTVTLRTSDYPTGGGLLVVITAGGDSSGRAVAPDPVSVAIFAFDRASKIPTCVDFSDPGSGTSGTK